MILFRYLNWAVLILTLIAASFTDIRTRRIPNRLTYSALVLALPNFNYFYLVVVAAALFIMMIAGSLIGSGDIKLAAVVAIYSNALNLSQSWILFALVLGGLYALIRRVKSLPFAPFIAIGTLIANILR